MHLLEAHQAVVNNEDVTQWRPLRVEIIQGLLDQLMVARLKATNHDVSALTTFIEDPRNSLRCRKAIFRQCQNTPYKKDKPAPKASKPASE